MQPPNDSDSKPTRRDMLLAVAALGAASQAGAATATTPAKSNSVSLVCIIRYQIDPYQREAFKTYAANWGHIIPRAGGHLIGYFLPAEGTNDVGWALIAFDSLAAYETYRARLRTDPEARANFELVQSKRIVLREERNFVEIVPGTFELPSTLAK